MSVVVSFSNVFVIIFLAGSALSYLISLYLEISNHRFRAKNGGVIPQVLKKYPEISMFDEEKLKNIKDYMNARFFVWLPQATLKLALKLSLAVFGYYVWCFSLVTSWFGSAVTFGATFKAFFFFMLFADIPNTVLDIPFGLYRQFGIEKRFGFSNMTFRLYMSDGIKNLFLSLSLSCLLTVIASALFIAAPKSWWIVLAVAMALIAIVMNIIYPKFIAPLFNKFQPLEEGKLKARMENMLEKAGFSSDGLFRMDASKRSNHSNAYFTGFGKAKRIVLYDTLINSLSVDEIESVMAHEVGHYKLKHITRRMVMMFPMMLVAILVVFKVSHIQSLYTGFGFPVTDINSMQYVGMQLVIMLFGSLSLLSSPIANAISRRHEYQADAYSAKLCGATTPLVTALMKLNSENLSEILPARIYSFFHYSHPTLVERTEALEKLEPGL